MSEFKSLSKSAFMAYLECPRRFHYQYVLKKPYYFPKHISKRGWDVHNGYYDLMEAFGKEATSDNFKTIAKQVLEKVDEEYRQPMYEVELARWEGTRNNPDIYSPVFCEKKFVAKMVYQNTRIELRGIPDCIFLDNDGKYIVLEVKSGNVSTWKINKAYKELIFYKILVEKSENIRIDKAVMYYPLNRSFTMKTFTKRGVIATLDQIKKVYDDTEFKKKYNEMSCKYCSFVKECFGEEKYD